MKKIITFIGFCFTLHATKAQTAGVQWKKNYGGSSTDQAKSVCKTSDNGFVTVGYTESSDIDATGQHGVRDILAIKTNSTGTIIWKRVIGGTSNDEAMSVVEKSDGDLLIAGYTESNNGDFTATASLPHRGGKDLFIVRLNSDGTTDWTKKFGGTGEDGANSVKEDASGNIYVAGYTSSNDFDVTGNHLNGTSTTYDYWVIKLNNTGTLLWKKVYGGSNDATNSSGEDKANSIAIVSNGDAVVTGYTRSIDGDVTNAIGGKDVWTIRLSAAAGNIIWQKVIGGTGWEEANSVDLTSNGDVIITGYTQSNDVNVTGNHGLGSKDIWVATMSASNGSLTAQKCLGGGAEENSYCIKRTADNGYIISGYSSSSTGDITSSYGGWDWWIVKLNQNLSIAWQKNLGGSLTELGGYGVVETNDGGYLIAGIASNLFEGTTGQFYGSEDFWLVKLANPSTGLMDTDIAAKISVYPNPANETVSFYNERNTNLKIEIYDASGKLVLSSGGSGSTVILNTVNFENGLYMIRVSEGENTFTKRLVIAH